MKRLVNKTLALFALITVEVLIVWGLMMACFGVFLFLIKHVFYDNATNFDRAAFAQAESIASPLVTQFMKFVTLFATHYFLIPAALLLSFYFIFIKRHRWYSIKVPVVAGGSTALNVSLKNFFARVRPEEALQYELHGYSFPSGHAMIGLSFYGLLIYLVWRHVESQTVRWLMVAALFGWALLIGYSRIYLHVHYATDVVAGLAAGAFWVVASIYLLRQIENYTNRNVQPVEEPVVK
jgi:membrane-associated phospholipid phosphatase